MSDAEGGTPPFFITKAKPQSNSYEDYHFFEATSYMNIYIYISVCISKGQAIIYTIDVNFVLVPLLFLSSPFFLY
jgi:hypothetical protein